MKSKKKYIIGAIAIVFLSVVSILMLRNKLTYLEFKSFNTSNDTYITIENDGEVLEQTFIMPYEIINGVSIQIGTYGQDNNSNWEFQLVDLKNDQIVYDDVFNASLMTDNGYNRIEFDKNIRVNKDDKYSFRIIANDVSPISKLAFYNSNKSQIENGELHYNGDTIDSDLCFKVYGGDADYWWCGFALLIFAILSVILARCYYVEKKGNKIFEDTIVCSLVIGVISFILLSSFSVAGGFCDESDNMYGGMVIAHGGVLYRDYVTQHTPVSYYLCAVFALLGAGSVVQFRLAFYILESAVWSFIYIRHSNYFGRKTMTLLPITEIICISSVVAPYGSQILSDGVQGILTVVLILELFRYFKDKKLDWDRCIIVSCCIWGSFGAAFVSAYALIWVAVIVVASEVKNWRDKNKINFRNLIGRYYKLIISIIVPFVCAVIYFKVNHSLKRAFDQFYTFNREVYPKYTSGLGDNVAQPFVNGIQNFFIVMADNFNAIIAATATNVQILQLVIMIFATTSIIILFTKKHFWEAFSLLLVLTFSATRGYGFHGIAAWYVAVMIVVLFVEDIKNALPKLGIPVMGLSAIVLLSTFIVAVGNNLLYEQSPISDMESEVILLTETDKNKDIYLDVWTSGSLYYFYKDRYPVNCALFMLPWYMDWYEQDNISALKEEKPRVVIYNEDEDTWGHTHYSVAFAEELKANYTRAGEDGWMYSLWIRNE